jgi:hypothetical protein
MRVEGADRLCNACRTTEEKLILWTLLDTGAKDVRIARPDAFVDCSKSGLERIWGS